MSTTYRQAYFMGILLYIGSIIWICYEVWRVQSWAKNQHILMVLCKMMRLLLTYWLYHIDDWIWDHDLSRAFNYILNVYTPLAYALLLCCHPITSRPLGTISIGKREGKDIMASKMIMPTPLTDAVLPPAQYVAAIPVPRAMPWDVVLLPPTTKLTIDVVVYRRNHGCRPPKLPPMPPPAKTIIDAATAEATIDAYACQS